METVNNVLTVLSTMLKVTTKWEVIERTSAQIESLKVPSPAISLYEFDEYERLVDAAECCGRRSSMQCCSAETRVCAWGR